MNGLKFIYEEVWEQKMSIASEHGRFFFALSYPKVQKCVKRSNTEANTSQLWKTAPLYPVSM